MYNIETTNTYLRRFEKDDYSKILEYLSNKESMKYIDEVYSEEKAKEYFDNILLKDDTYLAMTFKESNQIFGQITFKKIQSNRYEMTWICIPKYFGCGYTYELSVSLINALKKEKVPAKIYLKIKKENKRAIGLAKKLDFYVDKLVDGNFIFCYSII